MCDYKYKLCYVVYIDILGFKNKVFESTKDEKVLNEIIDLQDYLSIIQKDNGVSEKKAYFISDSIFLVFPFEKNDLSCVLWEIADIQARLIEMEFLIRGGLTIGDVIFSDKFLFGPAVTEAVQIEQKNENPCVVLSYHFFEDYLIKKAKIDYGDISQEIEEALLYLSKNENFRWITHINEQDLTIDKKDTRKQLIEMIEKGKKNQNDRVKNKYIWLENNIDL